MAVSILSRSQSSFTLQIEIPYTASMLESEDLIPGARGVIALF